MSQERNPYSNIKRVTNRCNTIDVHEIMKQQLAAQGAENGPGSNSIVAVNSTPNSQSTFNMIQQDSRGFEDYEFHFDSIDRDTSSDMSNGEMKWSISALNNNRDLKNCVEMRVGPIYFPRVNTAPGCPDYFFYRKVYMQILNLPVTQAIIGSKGNQYHFEFDVENLNSVAVKLKPTKETFFFQRPVSSLTDLAVRFMIPHNFRRISIPKDVVTIQSVNNSNPARFTITSGDLTTDLLGTLGPTILPGTAVYINSFLSANANVNNNVNTNDGLYITNIINATTFEIASLDLTSIPPTIGTMIIPKNHVGFPMRFTSVSDQPTNYTHVSRS